jgi:hypothetical protein
MSPLDRMIVAPFSLGVGSVTGPTNDRPTILQGIEAIRPAVARHPRLPGQVAQSLRNAEGGEGDVPSPTARRSSERNATGGGCAISWGNRGKINRHRRRSRDFDQGRAAAAVRLRSRAAAGSSFRRGRATNDVHDTLTDDVQNDPTRRRTADGRHVAGISVRTWIRLCRPGHHYFAPKPAPIARVEHGDRPGGRYLDLSKGDIEVLEDGAPQSVDLEAIQDVSIVLARDARQKKKEADVIGARDFVGALQARSAGAGHVQ